MEQALPQIIIGIILSAIVALLGKNRKIGYGLSFIACLFLSPIIGIIIILLSKKNKDNVEFIEIKEKDIN